MAISAENQETLLAKRAAIGFGPKTPKLPTIILNSDLEVADLKRLIAEEISKVIS